MVKFGPMVFYLLGPQFFYLLGFPVSVIRPCLGFLAFLGIGWLFLQSFWQYCVFIHKIYWQPRLRSQNLFLYLFSSFISWVLLQSNSLWYNNIYLEIWSIVMNLSIDWWLLTSSNRNLFSYHFVILLIIVKSWDWDITAAKVETDFRRRPSKWRRQSIKMPWVGSRSVLQLPRSPRKKYTD